MNNEKKIIILFFTLILIFVSLAFIVNYGNITRFDTAIYEFIIQFQSAYLTSFMIFMSTLGDGIGVVTIILTLLIVKPTRYEIGIPVAITVVISTTLHLVLKQIIRRERPGELVLIEAGGFSFPSGHSMNNMAMYAMIVICLFTIFHFANITKILLGTLILMVPILIGLSRIYLGVHYPSDVLAGFAGGVAVAIGVYLWVLPQFKKIDLKTLN